MLYFHSHNLFMSACFNSIMPKPSNFTKTLNQHLFHMTEQA